MKNNLTKARAGRNGRTLFLFLALALSLLATDVFAQTFSVTVQQRRMGNQIGVEFWIKDVTAGGTAPNLGNMSVAVTYNTTFLSPADPAAAPTYDLGTTDSVEYNVNQASPYKTITSPFNIGAYGYQSLQSQASNIGGTYVYELDVRTAEGAVGYKPGTTGRGSFVGILKFDIINHENLTSSTLTDIAINLNTSIGDFRIFDINNNDMEAVTTLETEPSFTIKGITILNPNGPNEALNRYKTYSSLLVAGYPIYFERSGLLTPANTGTEYGSDALAYVVTYSTNGGASWSAEAFRFAETRLTVNDLNALGEDDLLGGTGTCYHYDGEITTNTGTNDGYLVTQGDGNPLPVETLPGYGGVLRVIWAADKYFAARSEQAYLRICQLDTTGRDTEISLRNASTDNICKTSDNAFVLSRLFFLQLNGDLYNGCKTYLRTRDNYSNSTQLTVEAWINLNEINATGSEVGIVATGPGPAKPEDEGAWMLYLKDGKYPAFRAREIIGGAGRGENGGNYIATVVSNDELSATSDAFPINSNASHSQNWVHVAATVFNNVVSLYVNGELKARTTNSNAVDIRMATYEHPVWIGLNPYGTITDDDYLHAGIKEVRVWRKALPQEVIRTIISGLADPTTVFPADPTDDKKNALELYYNFIGISDDLATLTVQNGNNPINFYENCSGTITQDNSLMRFRPDRGHIKLTAPVGGEGVSNLNGQLFTVRWAAYGLGDIAASTNDLIIEFSRNGGSTWALAMDNTIAPEGLPLNEVDIEDAEAIWEPYNNVNVIGSYLDLRGIEPPSTQYSKDCLLRIRGTSDNRQDDIYDISGTFVVAPYFALKSTGNSILSVPPGTALNMMGGSAMLEAWIRPYRFPTAEEVYFPIINKKDETTGDLHYALRLLPTGQIQLAIGKIDGSVVTAESDITKPLSEPNKEILDSVWTHIAVFVNLANGTGDSYVLFYIDGNYQRTDVLTSQLKPNVAVNSDNTYKTWIAYEPDATAPKYYIGEMKEIRFWNGVPANMSYSGSEPTALTNFIRGALAVRGNELLTTPTNYKANLAAVFSFNGGSWVKNAYPATTTISDYSTSSIMQAQVLQNNGLSYTAVQPYIKLVEPTFLQQVPNTTTNLTVRWVGFDYGRNLMQTGDNVVSIPSDLEFSIWGGGETETTPYNPTSSIYENTNYDPNSFSLPSTSTYRFDGILPPAVQFAGSLRVDSADADINDDGTYDDRGPISATLTNARLRVRDRAQINTVSPLEYTSFSHLRSEGPLFTITPASNFTVRALMEGFHKGTTAEMSGMLGTGIENNGVRISLYESVSGQPSRLVKTAESAQGYSQTDPGDPVLGNPGSEFANIPFVFTDVADGNYFVLVEHTNHLPVMSREVAPFGFDGDDLSTWAIESGWDFITWNGVKNDATYSAWGYRETNPASSDYGATGLIYSQGVNDTYYNPAPTNALAAMVAGDIVRDGMVNAADRVKVRVDAGGNTFASDVTGDGEINSTDRQLVDKNSNRIASVGDLFPSMYPASMVLVQQPNTAISNLDVELSEVLNAMAQSFEDNGMQPEISEIKGDKTLAAAGVSYKVTGETKIEGDYVLLSIYIQNIGEEFAPANCTFGVRYNPNLLEYVELTDIDESLWSNNPLKGYAGYIYSAPRPDATNPMSDIRSIEIDYDNYSRKAGVVVPYSKTIVGTLKFKIRQTNAQYDFEWYKSTALYRTDGGEITQYGIFELIKPVSTITKLYLISPNGNEIWKVGRSYNISWNKPSDAVSVNIELSIDGGETWTRISEKSISSSAASYDWIAGQINSDECLIRIVNAANGEEIDRSDNFFSIVPPVAQITRPNSSDPVYIGGRKDVIKWTVEDASQVYFEFSENGATNWQKVTATVSSQTGQIEWTVPSVNSKNAVVAMYDSETKSLLAVSEPFKVLTGSVAFITPSAGESVPNNKTKAVRWASQNVLAFDLELTLDGGATWTRVDNNLNALKGNYNWAVGNYASNNAMLRAIWNNDPDMEYARTAKFNIYGIVSVDEDLYTFSIDEPVPNPFSDETKIGFTIPSTGSVYLSVYNSAGVKVADILSGENFMSGYNAVNFKAGNLSSGVYYMKLQSGSEIAVKEIIIVK
jgi:hypothetical protein